jgi:hypothetical protein
VSSATTERPAAATRRNAGGRDDDAAAADDDVRGLSGGRGRRRTSRTTRRTTATGVARRRMSELAVTSGKCAAGRVWPSGDNSHRTESPNVCRGGLIEPLPFLRYLCRDLAASDDASAR